ncbi:bifunctional 2-polyprenyl-6-hydroxyphenol methylase/3-demethylubiquinol 3-O-methyltransferase UbiG [Pigmentiphaga litoralis]|uniref:Ubiquinone biosynthesis O-methyltransferase n=1 Tax=Pigmentiphaga litoralis TaxID=516702 RepID=A0A7Y9J0S2_9BURK|nr:bifunctional 2-polyprenyl-6-hydroxyphenol methylase/3-demethylubiquinol 3-O-methyltransferase UbiG [Pigmentiphaga litoralis]NYE26587.1 2-polyprenyl-6-hydroxyphenyl methylase/3-demethylubiquinone-9 3-methyltransferase [Pigmentiphaga litoralis]NYE86003.1 2-polyprenyl-6-hydroxyphenyl methylase/3-demethylubiquinone-9 3-methyltransferase [Pigmentiphaga litoralis]
MNATVSAPNTPHVNADAAELAKFSALASRWWDPESEFKPLHAINPLRLDWISQNARGLGNKKVLDVGCGGGILAESMAARGAIVTGIDLAEKSLKVARLHSLETGIKVEYRNISAEQIAADEPGQYDVVTCMEMLEHVPDPGSIIRACAALVKPGGHVMFSTINRNLKAFGYMILGAEYLLRLVPQGTHSYESFIRPSELIGDARRAGLEATEIRGLQYQPIGKRYSLTSDTSVNYMVAMVRT